MASMLRTSFLAGIAVGAVAVAAVALTSADGGRDAPARPGPTTTSLPAGESDAAAEAFVAAWRRNLEGSWALDQVIDRTNRTGQTISFESRRVRRPPDRMTVSGGSVTLRRDDRLITCAAGETGLPQCREEAAAKPFAQEVDEEVTTIRRYVVGSGRLYAVRRDGRGCFALRLVIQIPAPPYGRSARFCFDRRSGALVASAIVRVEGRESMRAENLRSPATEADLEPASGLMEPR